MKFPILGLLAIFLFAAAVVSAQEPTYLDTLKNWRETMEKNLTADNSWLTLAGRFPLKKGINTFGTGKDNDIIFPPEVMGTGTARLGTLTLDPEAKKVILKLPEGVTWLSEGKPFKGERLMNVGGPKRDWVSFGRISLHIIEREGGYFVRLADNESAVRKNFTGRIWYPADEKFKVDAKFVTYPEGKTLPIVNVLDQVTKEPCPGYLQFQLKGEMYQLDAIRDGDGLFIIFRDATAGDTTYNSARFLVIDKIPKTDEIVTLDFNKAYNPPCAFSEFTTCPRPPKQNILKIRIEAGEKYREKK